MNTNGNQYYLIELKDNTDGYSYYTVCAYRDVLNLLINVSSNYTVELVELLDGRFEKDCTVFMQKENKNVSK